MGYPEHIGVTELDVEGITEAAILGGYGVGWGEGVGHHGEIHYSRHGWMSHGDQERGTQNDCWQQL